MAVLMQAGAVQAVDTERLAQQHDAAPNATIGEPDLKSVISMAELKRRPSRAPDHAGRRGLETTRRQLHPLSAGFFSLRIKR